MTQRSLVFVATAGDAPPPRQGAAVVVLDTAWTPTVGDRPDLIPARRVLGRVVERVDLFEGALQLVDQWATTTGIADSLTVEGTTYWYRLRETMWRWLHERMLWRAAMVDLERLGAIELLGGHTRLHVLADHVQDLGRQPSGHAHFFLLGRGLNGDMATHEGVHGAYLRKALF